jgi:hypothetical protein
VEGGECGTPWVIPNRIAEILVSTFIPPTGDTVHDSHMFSFEIDAGSRGGSMTLDPSVSPSEDRRLAERARDTLAQMQPHLSTVNVSILLHAMGLGTLVVQQQRRQKLPIAMANGAGGAPFQKTELLTYQLGSAIAEVYRRKHHQEPPIHNNTRTYTREHLDWMWDVTVASCGHLCAHPAYTQLPSDA